MFGDVSIRSAWLPDVDLNLSATAFGKKGAAGEASTPASSSSSSGTPLWQRLIKPSVHVDLEPFKTVDWQPGGAPGETLWPLPVLVFGGAVAVVLWLAWRGLRSFRRK